MKFENLLDFRLFSLLFSDSFFFVLMERKSSVPSLRCTVCQLSLPPLSAPPLSSRSCQLSYFVSSRVSNWKCRHYLKGIQKCTSKTGKKRHTQNSYTCVRACVCVCVCIWLALDACVGMCLCVCVRVSFVVKLCKEQKQMRRHRRRTQNFHTKKLFKKKYPLIFVRDFLARLPFLRIWVAVVVAL